MTSEQRDDHAARNSATSTPAPDDLAAWLSETQERWTLRPGASPEAWERLIKNLQTPALPLSTGTE